MLRSQGKTYPEIVKIMGVSKSLVSYYCAVDGKLNNQRRRQRSAAQNVRRIKDSHGGKCCLCGYNKCFNALEFHHLDPKEKKHDVLKMLRDFSYESAVNEAKKCILVCSNCHREIHAGVTIYCKEGEKVEPADC